MMFNHVIIGGTFDHFHLGHQRLIEVAFKKGERVTIGIAIKDLYKNKILSQTIEDYSMRKKSVSKFLTKKSWQKKTKIIPITNIYGTTLIDKTIDAIVVSQATKKTAERINRLRQKKGWPGMKIIVVDDVLAEDGKLITSERIRMGEIDRRGKQYQISNISPRGRSSFGRKYQKKRLSLPEEMRKELRKPLGKVFKNTKSLLHYINLPAGRQGIMEWPIVIAVGDIINLSLLQGRFNPDVKIIDFRSRRMEIPNYKLPITNKLQITNYKKYTNKPGTINIKTADKLRRLIQNATLKKQKSWLVVDGEEDLLALPAIFFSPLHSLVLYGQMDLGVVAVEVTEAVKNIVKKLLGRFI
ncbi:hypothetical protein COS31_00240 [Candidatus Roizmanbacteria bacterium CG02_land_8_20_14_3_00_36_15]|uniref:Cytidyltransferase-like domain-containing protein n=2 Tax=Candidatus Roizmaniibacteriota TaxID=1752723 RepID=A0A2M8KK13_9BACT|nr:MAG: hypothetical protein COS51_04790 [Candidatus Roizmanbacteria bacterium CG03_land_8_20_14_0_80_36_21]PIV38293.1 MAG: hypothetical protein COS31_00240 [Candidatus Roizmanbacteria bacterium CG02_land_8_20_14_3_00_36_15]PIY69822.1 MAG: hypothetical protein COY89_04405 [Candidatus Roizmanbacteria bacterium CG_4_10_14_0_8_um_filter_36_36]PJA53447.1 MAG: hypothetical protein CO166_01855 [Candidatus Roizmanbacteria bacterium CG_4_9_14_3_um_filter_36_11]PJC81448.1 MAG: hypothetical protein CO007